MPLGEFIDHVNPDFPAIARECSASSLLNEDVFKPDVLDSNKATCDSEYFLSKFTVHYIKKKAYVLCQEFEQSGNANIWIAYTELSERDKSYMSKLLKAVDADYEKLEIETDSKTLERICQKLDIQVTFKKFGIQWDLGKTLIPESGHA